MLVNFVRYPPVKQGKDADFRKWFVESKLLRAKDRVHDEADAGYCVIRIEAAAPSAAVHEGAEKRSVPASA